MLANSITDCLRWSSPEPGSAAADKVWQESERDQDWQTPGTEPTEASLCQNFGNFDESNHQNGGLEMIS